MYLNRKEIRKKILSIDKFLLPFICIHIMITYKIFDLLLLII